MAQLVTRVPMEQAEITRRVRAELGQISELRWQKINLLPIQSELKRKDQRIEGLTLDDIRTALLNIFKYAVGQDPGKVWVGDIDSHGECVVLMNLE